MKNKSLFKRALSAVLCAVMLVSCWVFTAPSASAADTWYAGNSSVKNSSTTAHTGTSTLTSNRTGQYRVRLLVKEVTQFDEAIHDRPGSVFNSKDFPYEPGFAFGPNDSDSQRNLSGTSTSQDLGDCEVVRDKSLTQHKYWCEYAKISYKTMNGSSAGADGAVWFNLGDQDQGGRQDGISGGGWNWGYFPSDDGVVIDGFPTGFTTRYYNTKAIDGKKEYYHVWLQVAKWTGTNTWNWDDYGGTCTNGKNLFGNASVDDKYCKGIADVGCNMNSKSKVNELKASQTVDASKFPYATTGTATANNTTAKTTAPTVNFTTTSSTTQISSVTLPSTSASTVSRRVYYTDPYDQYGAVMASTIQLNYSQSGKKSYFTQDGTTTGFAYGANITGDTDTQQLRAYVTWPSASNAATALSAYSNELTVNDASYTVKFKDASGNTIQNGTSGDLTRTVYYGSNASAPAASTYAKAYDTNNHYTFNTWDPSNTNVTSDRTCVPQYNEIAHTMENDDTLPGYVAATCLVDGTQPRKCSGCEYTDSKAIPAPGHTVVRKSHAPCDGGGTEEAYEYYCCVNEGCNMFWPAVYGDNGYPDPDTFKFKESKATSEAGVKNGSTKIPAPIFNDYSDNTIQDEFGETYQYGNRGSSLKLMKNVGEFNAATTKQDFRFSGSVAIPKGVSYEIGSRNDNVIKDFGFVYSQDSHIWNDDEGKADTDQLVLDSGDNKIATMSVVNNNAAKGNVIGVNAGRLNGEYGEWSGVTFHPGDGSDEFPDSLTFNLVISIKATNWKMQYAARPYITYMYNGEEYTVYDTGASAQGGQVLRPEYSCCSVYSLASYIAVLNPNNSAAQYCTDNILAHEALLYPTSFDDNKKSDEFTDWWKWVEGDTSWSDFTDPNRQNGFYKDYCTFMNNYQ